MSRTGLLWVNFHPSDLERAKQFMDNMKGDKTVDVLGLLKSMEAVSDMFFPATSTLHKKIRYQIFIPSIILSMYTSKWTIDAEVMLRKFEYQLQQTLIASGEKYSVFGSSRGEALKYWPSVIYWSSLNALKLFGEFNMGRYEALEIIEDRNNSRKQKSQEGLDYDLLEINFPNELIKIFHKIFPNGRMSEKLNFGLSKDEAEFLRDRFIKYFPHSMTSYILNNRNSMPANAEFFNLKCLRDKNLNNLLHQSENFSRVAMGANYAYRWALCRAKRIQEGERINLAHLKMWIGNNRDILQNWQFHDLIKATLHLDRQLEDSGEATFIEEFLKFTCGSKIINTNKLNELSHLMQFREEKIKGRHMSHFNNTKLQIPQNVLGKEEYTDFLFNYRWRQGRDNLEDIFIGLKKR